MHLHNLSLGSEVIVYRENDGWTGPYPFLGIENETVKVQLLLGSTNFRSTSIKPFYDTNKNDAVPKDNGDSHIPPAKDGDLKPFNDNVQNVNSKRPTVDEVAPIPIIPEGHSQRERRLPARFRDISDGSAHTTTSTPDLTIVLSEALVTSKEVQAMELALKLRREGKITTQGTPFQES